MWMMNLEKPTKMPQLNEAMAIDLGSQILGEAVIFFTAAFLVIVEYSRQVNKEEKKEEMTQAELYSLEDKINHLKEQLSWQRSKIQNLNYTIQEMNTIPPQPSSPPPPSSLSLTEPMMNVNLPIVTTCDEQQSVIATDKNNKPINDGYVSETTREPLMQSYSDNINYYSVLNMMP